MKHDYFLELMSNPTFNPKDFELVGLDSDNTDIGDREIYKKSELVRQNPLFLDNEGNFDEDKFNEVYDLAFRDYNTLARQTEKLFFREDLFAPKELRADKEKPEYEIVKVNNPLRLLEGFVNFGLKEAPTKSVREIAEGKPVYDYETGEWKESAEDNWIDNFLNPKVLALWDFDADENGNPTDIKENIVYHKGDKKINPVTGTYYWETLGNRDIYGREVLSGFDTLTKEGSVYNKYDFFDSDDIKKSTFGSVSRSLALILPVFVPYVGEAYIMTRVGLSLSQLIPTVGKIFTGNDSPFLSKMEAFDKAISFSTSDATQGSTEAGIAANPWTMETALKLISDVFTQLAEQRWIFKYGTSLFSGVAPEALEEGSAARQALIESKAAKMDLNLSKIAKRQDDILMALDLSKLINFLNAKRAIEKLIKNGQEIGKYLSLAYMTGITTADSYGEAINQGASELEASIFALGYTAGEFALLNTDIGKWILPELKMERFAKELIGRTLMSTAGKNLPAAATPEAKRKLWSKIFNYGKQLATHHYNDKTLTSTSKMMMSNMMAEGIEETSEELLLDLSKQIFNAANSLRPDGFKFNDAWENMAARYTLSFIGGTVGGGLASTLPSYRAAIQAQRAKLNPDQQAAYQQMVYYIKEGKADELIKTAWLLDGIASKTLSMERETKDGITSYKPASRYEDSQDYWTKVQFERQVHMVEDILKSIGADLSDEGLLNDYLLRQEMKFYGLLNSNVLGVYTNDFLDTISELTPVIDRINKLEDLKSGTDKDLTDGQNRQNEKKGLSEQEEKELSNLKKHRKELEDKLQAYINGEMSNEFIGEALFEMDTNVSSAYVPTNAKTWIEREAGKPIDQLTKSELEDLYKKFNLALLSVRDLIHRSYQVFKLNQLALANLLEKYNLDYLVPSELNVINNLDDIFMGFENSGNIEDAQEYLSTGAKFDIWRAMLNVLKEEVDSSLFEELQRNFNESTIPIEKAFGVEAMPLTFEEFMALPENTQLDLIEGQGNINEENFAAVMNKIQTEYYDKLRYTAQEGLIKLLHNDAFQKAFINKIKEAKYITPATKEYLRQFIKEIQGTKSYDTLLKAINDAKSSPIEELLSSMVLTLKSNGIDTTNMIADLASQLQDLAAAGNLANFILSDDFFEKVKDTLLLIDIAHAHLEASKTTIEGEFRNYIGYNATMNELLQKYPKEGTGTLAQLDANSANSLIRDLAKIAADLRFYQAISAANSNLKLTDHIRTDLKLNTLYLQRLMRVAIPNDWEGKESLEQAINDALTTKSLLEEGKDIPTDLEYEQIFKERVAIEQALHLILNLNIDKLEELFNQLNLLENLQSILNSNTKLQRDADLVWRLASLAAVDPTLVLNEYKNVLDGEYAPVIAQEESIRRAYAYLINPDIFNKFAEAYNKAFKKQFDTHRNEYQEKGYDSDNYILSSRHFLISGIAGSGKSSAVYSTLYNLLALNGHESLLDKVWIVSNSEDNAENLRLSILKRTNSRSIENAIVMSKQDYFLRITQLDYSGLIPESINELISDEDGIYHYKNYTINSNPTDVPSLVIVDEVSSFSQLDLLLSDKFLRAIDKYAVVAGDFSQLGATGNYEIPETGDKLFIRLTEGNFMGNWKLGTSIRFENYHKAINEATFREKGLSLRPDGEMSNIANSMMEISKGIYPNPIPLSYYLGLEGLFGDMYNPINPELAIEIMINTLKSSEKINYIGSRNSKLYQKYKEHFNEPISPQNALSLEGLYYVIDIEDLFDDLVNETIDSNNSVTIELCELFGKILYTAITRSKQGSLIIGNFLNLLVSVPQNSPQIVGEFDRLTRNDFAEKRRNIISRVIGDISDKTKLVRRKVDETSPETEEPSETPPSKDVIPKIDNSGDNVQCLVHTMMLNETGCDIVGGSMEPTDPNTVLKLGRFYQNRIDSFNGLAQLSDRTNKEISILGVDIAPDGTIRKGKDLLFGYLNRLRGVSQYYSGSELKKRIASILNVNPDTLRIDWVYRDTCRLFNDEDVTIKNFSEGGKLSKFKQYYKGFTEWLYGLFGNTTKEVRTPRDKTFNVVIQYKGKNILEIPIGKLTSPLTLLTTKGFEDIKAIFDDVEATTPKDNVVTEFKKRIKEAYKSKLKIHHLELFAKLLELYTDSSNSSVYLEDSFNLGNPTGILIDTHVKGDGYLTDDYIYDGHPVDLELYKKDMPGRKITAPLIAIKGFSINGFEVAAGTEFVLVTDAYEPNTTDKIIVEEWSKQIVNKTTPKIRLIKITSPLATFREYILNFHNAYIKNIENIDIAMGNKMSPFNILNIILNDSNFRAKFREWAEGSLMNTENIENRINVLTELINFISSNPDPKERYKLVNGELTKDLIEKLKYKIADGKEGVIYYEPNKPLRYVLQRELHSMLLATKGYHQIPENVVVNDGGQIKFAPEVESKIEAFEQAMRAKNWTGIDYNLIPENQSSYEFTLNDIEFSFAPAASIKDFRISGRNITINGKLDSSAFVMNLTPKFLDYILRGIGRKIDTIDERTSHIFETDPNSKIKNQNTSRFLSNLKPDTSTDTRLSAIINGTASKKLINAFLQLTDDEKSKVLNDPREFILKTLKKPSYLDENGKVTIVENNALKVIENVIYLNDSMVFSSGNVVYKTTKEGIETIPTLELLNDLGIPNNSPLRALFAEEDELIFDNEAFNLLYNSLKEILGEELLNQSIIPSILTNKKGLKILDTARSVVIRGTNTKTLNSDERNTYALEVLFRNMKSEDFYTLFDIWKQQHTVPLLRVEDIELLLERKINNDNCIVTIKNA